MKKIKTVITFMFSCYSAMSSDNIIAKTLYAEARSERVEGIVAVATVIHNRANGNYQKAIKECLKPKQFSCWNGKNDIKVPNIRGNYKPKNKWNDVEAWKFCLEIQNDIKTGFFKPKHKWNHYAVTGIKVSWYNKMREKQIVGKHTFGVL